MVFRVPLLGIICVLPSPLFKASITNVDIILLTELDKFLAQCRCDHTWYCCSFLLYLDEISKFGIEVTDNDHLNTFFKLLIRFSVSSHKTVRRLHQEVNRSEHNIELTLGCYA